MPFMPGKKYPMKCLILFFDHARHAKDLIAVCIEKIEKVFFVELERAGIL